VALTWSPPQLAAQYGAQRTGALTTFTVALAIATTKFLEGAWIVVLLIPLLVLLFLSIHRHYHAVEREQAIIDAPLHAQDVHHRFIVPILELTSATRYALAYAASVSSQVLGVHVATNKKQAAGLRAAWNQCQQDASARERFDLHIIDPGYHGLLGALLAFLHEVSCASPEETLTVLLPEREESSWKRLFSHPTMLKSKAALFFQPHLVVTNVSFSRPTPVSQFPLHTGKIRHCFIVPLADMIVQPSTA